MRVVAGTLRHREIKMTNLDTTRETQDKVRQAIFTMIGPYFDGGVALDLFAGSGAMAIEAYSRGISEIYLNDLNPKALEICKDNCENLQISKAKFFNMDYNDFLAQNLQKMDLILLDPPYKMDNTNAILEAVYPHLSPNGIVVFEMARDTLYVSGYKQLEIWKDKTYGIKRVVVYRLTS